ncbi:MAG TPA: DUF2892 domain-containing protein [Mycobacterium sp.]
MVDQQKHLRLSGAFGMPEWHGWPIERITTVLSGVMVLVTVTLAYLYTPMWLLFTAFVGANLLFSGLVGWCPASVVLHRLGVPPASECARNRPRTKTV